MLRRGATTYTQNTNSNIGIKNEHKSRITESSTGFGISLDNHDNFRSNRVAKSVYRFWTFGLWITRALWVSWPAHLSIFMTTYNVKFDTHTALPRIIEHYDDSGISYEEARGIVVSWYRNLADEIEKISENEWQEEI